MTISQDQTPSVRCPRCGGLMRKPSGSSFYWHTDSNHPRCEITNLADISTAARATEKIADGPKQTPGKM